LLKAIFASSLCLALIPWLAPGQGTTKAVPQKKAAVKSKKKSTKRIVRRPLTQQQPTPERYREVQQALIDRGYLQAPATGVWEPGSMAALKKYQTDQKLEATGKLDSLSLIRLGLGPQRDVPSQNGRVPPAVPKAGP
jgi:peptidoglycan hydrolase-like protein with peptidoglycan-binding domain